MLDDVKHHNDVRRTKLGKRLLVGHAMEHVQALRAARRCCGLGNFYAADIKVAASFLQKETVGAANFQQLPAGPMLADEFHSVREFSPQHGLCALIIAITVRMTPGKVIFGVISCSIEVIRLSASKPTASALENVTAVFRK